MRSVPLHHLADIVAFGALGLALAVSRIEPPLRGPTHCCIGRGTAGAIATLGPPGVDVPAALLRSTLPGGCGGGAPGYLHWTPCRFGPCCRRE